MVRQTVRSDPYTHDPERLRAVRLLLDRDPEPRQPPQFVACSPPLSTEARDQKKAELWVAYRQHSLLADQGDVL
jgi:hypothetical protein